MAEEAILFEGETPPATPPASAAPSDNGRKPEGDWVPRHRLNEVSAREKAHKDRLDLYSKLGTPEELADKLKRGEEMLKGRTFTPSEKDLIRTQFLEAMPEFRVWQADRELRTQHATRTALSRLDGFMGELGVTHTKDNEAEFTKRATQLENILTAIIQADPVMVSRAAVHDLSVFDDAWKEFKKAYGIGQQRRQQDAKLEQLKRGRPPLPAAAPKAQSEPGKAKSEREIFAEANEKALDMLGALEEA